MAITVCPDRATIERLLLGQVDLDDANSLDRHLLECEGCCAVLEELAGRDALADTVRAATARVVPLDEAMRAVIAQLKAVTLPGKAIEETLARGGETTGDAWELENLLDPPEAEGELGRFGGYRVLRVLGAGGMGLVLEAEDPKLRRRVALKVMKRSLASRDEHHQRFLREARAAAAIDHPHIVTVHEVGEYRELPFMAMQLLKGEALDDRLRRPPTLPLGECLRIGRETAEALAEAHDRNLIHRDIKPGNIWLEGTKGWVKLLDFGLAHASEDVHLTQTGAIMGTPAYMSPEQARGETVDGRSDLYSLGAVLYKLTTGDVPFRGASTMAVLMALATEAPRRPSELNPDVPPALDDLILRLLAKKPDERFESAVAVADAIRSIEQVMVAPTLRGGEAVAEGDRLAPPSRSAGSTVRRRPRWLVAAAAAVFVLATIVIIVRDKDGKELYRGTVPDGGSATFTEGDVASKVDPVLRDGGASPSPEGRPAPSPRTVGATLPEPPPLDEWLKGRTALTVAQDGSAQFKTIQAALDALQQGQVVSVLDRGPYRERLVLEGVPADTGLVSRVGTRIELSEWKSVPREDAADFHEGHVFAGIDGFRLHGFELAFPQGISPGCKLRFSQTIGLVLEHCLVRAVPMASEFGEPLAVDNISNEAPGFSAHVRDCVIEGYLELHAHRRADVTLIVERNCFSSGRVDHHLHFHGDAWKQVLVRNNIFIGQADHNLLIKNGWKPSSVLEVSNNTTTTAVDQVIFTESAHHGRVTIRNNLCTSPCLLAVFKGAEKDLTAAQANWHVDHNVYPEPSRGQTDLINWIRNQGVPRSSTDVASMPRFLSKDVSNRDYLRIAADGPLANSGAGGDWPTYIGALPPGPAPKEGDWFTRLRERWDIAQPEPAAEKRVAFPPSVEIADPPPLEEWLKGRTVLTVAQDGSGQFKTIQAALTALKPHEVVKVLDKGPYRELLTAADLPDDTGLISLEQATIEVPALQDANQDDTENKHHLGPADGFRLSGLRFLAPPRKSWGPIIECWRCWGMVIEDCRFGWTAPPLGKTPFGAIAFYTEERETSDSPIVLRNCVFDSASVYLPVLAAFLIERNFFRDAIIGFEGSRRKALIRHNVFVREQLPVLDLKRMGDIAEALEITNNTVYGGNFSVREGAAKRRVTIRNNITSRGVELDSEADKRRAEIIQNWLVDHNSYLRVGSLPKAASDLRQEPGFLSTRENERDYLRIPADSPLATSGVSGDLPTYIGALHPGPAPKDGDWFTRLRDRWDIAKPERAAEKAAAIPPPVKIAEPPPLEEWLKGRTVLTVARDGSGQFKTIQAALDAMKTGQVVEVLDGGPYRESLRMRRPPENTGLVSRHRAIVEVDTWDRPDDDSNPYLYGHHIYRARGFRVNGLRFLSAYQKEGAQWYWQNPAELVVEDCLFYFLPNSAPQGPTWGMKTASWLEDAVEPIVVRDCLFNMGGINAAAGDRCVAPFLITRNYFHGGNAILLFKTFRRLVIRQNVFDGPDVGLSVWWMQEVPEAFEIACNTFFGRAQNDFKVNVPQKGVIVRNNIFTEGVQLTDGAIRELANATNWQSDHNCYQRRGSIPSTETDLIIEPEFLSVTPGDGDYLRVATDGPIARGGAGGSWPNYMGALAPGAAPKEGDWFTRLRDRWGVVARTIRDGSASP